MNRAWIALGGNLDRPEARIRSVFGELDRLPRTHFLRASSLYRSVPVGYADQPDFINAVALVETALSPDALMHELLALETRHGRVRTVRNGPRTLDLDLLMYGGLVLDDPFITLPHPRMHLRAFVLLPMLEIDADCEIPGQGRADLLLRQVDQTEVQRLSDFAGGFEILCALGRGMCPPAQPWHVAS